HLLEIVDTIEGQYDDRLLIFDITTDIGIPAMYVSMTAQRYPIQPSGCGASLSPAYALERALLESLQPRHVYNDILFENQNQIIQQLEHMPLLQKAAIADVLSVEHDATSINFKNCAHDSNHFSLKIQFNAIIA